MLSVAVHKDIAEYEPKIIGKLTARTLISIAGALGLSVATGLYMYFVLGLNVSDNMFVIYAVSLPFWLCGFWKPKGMPFEKFLPLWLEFKFSKNQCFYQPSIYKLGLVDTASARAAESVKKGKQKNVQKYRKFVAKTKGIEAYSPRCGKVI